MVCQGTFTFDTFGILGSGTERWMRGKPKEPRNPLGEAELVRGDDASSETSPYPTLCSA